jgi:hypothetical protein
MTRIKALEDQKAIFTAQKEELENKRGDIYVREQQAISDALLPFFEGFSPYAYIEVLRGSVYFKADHPECSYKKELFNLYLRENYNFEENKQSFNGVDLSYYTTSTKGVDDWELRRLRMLGDLAEIVLNCQQGMIDAANKAVEPFKIESDQVYTHMGIVGKAIRELDEKISALKKEKITFDLMNEGIQFDKGVHIQMKHNYTPHISSIKLIDVSKSGKKATAVFEWNHGGQSSREENVNINSITSQVLGYINNIIQPSLVE